MAITNYTSFSKVYESFFGKITDDMYMEWTIEDTQKDLYNIFVDALPNFEFPRFSLYDFDETSYNIKLTSEEVNILDLLMYNVWLQRQIASIEHIRMKYSGSDFKMTSQANHLDKLLKLKQEAERQSLHMQRLYKRRKLNADGTISSNWGSIMEESVLS